MAYQPYVPAVGAGPQAGRVTLASKNFKALAKVRAAKPMPPTDQFGADPLSLTPQAQIDQTIKRFTGMYGTPQTPQQIQTSAQGMLDPIVAAITKSINDRATASSAAITGNANSLAQSLGKIDFAAPYASAQHDQAAVDAALQQSLTGGGSALAADLQNRLGVIGDPSVGAAGGAVSAYGAGTGTNELASGSANLGQLLAEAAAAKSYGQKQPGIARLQGLQDIAGVNQNAVNQIGDQTSSVMQQLPSLVQNLRNSAQSLTGDRASAAASLYGLLTGQNITKATAQAGLQNTGFDNGLAYANTFGVDPVTGAPTLAARKAATAAAKAKQPKPLTTTDKARLTKAADTLRYGEQPKYRFDSKGDPSVPQGQPGSQWVAVPGTGTPNSSYSEAIQSLVAAGAPEAYARQLANGLYKPGEFGRPASKAQKKTTAAVKSGLGVPKTAGPFAGLTGAKG